MRETLIVPQAVREARADKALTPGMELVVLRIGDAVDRARILEPATDARWFRFVTAELRGGRDDNQALVRWLRGLTGVKLAGEVDGQPWEAVLVAEWRIEDAGAAVRVLVPPAALNAIRAPKTFGVVETDALNRLTGVARRLYLSLADKKRLEQSEWTYDVEELRAVLGVEGRKSYSRWDCFRQWCLDPAVSRINELGTVHVTMEPVRKGRFMREVRFSWRWKTLAEAKGAALEAERHGSARGKPRDDGGRDAPPLVGGREVLG